MEINVWRFKRPTGQPVGLSRQAIGRFKQCPLTVPANDVK
jgi:hypothetical protein